MLGRVLLKSSWEESSHHGRPRIECWRVPAKDQVLLSSLLSTSEHTIWMDIFHRSSSPGLQPPCASLVCYPILKSNKRHSDSNSILCSVSKKGGGDSEKSLRHQIASSSSSVTTQDCMSLFPVVVITAFNWQTPFLFANLELNGISF